MAHLLDLVSQHIDQFKSSSVTSRVFLTSTVFTSLFFAYIFLRRILPERTSTDANKCLARVGHRWPLGIHLLLEASAAESTGTLLQVYNTIFELFNADTVERYMLGLYTIDTRDPACVDAILNTQFHDFTLSDRPKAFAPLLGDGIFTQDGQAWKKSRDLLRPQFKQTRTKSFPVLQREIEDFIGGLQNQAEDESVIDLQPLFFQLTFDTSLAILCGGSTIKTGSLDSAEFSRAFDYAQSCLMLRARLGPLYWLVNSRQFRKSCNIVRSFVDTVVQEALRKQDQIDDGPDRYVFLHDLISTTRDPVVLRDQLVNILLAGRDTTACLLSWTMKFLARHQDIQAELRTASLSLESHRTNGMPTVKEIRSMGILENVLNETLRLYPPVPLNSRAAVEATTLPVGGGHDKKSPVTVNKGQAVAWSLFSMQRLEHVWGLDSNDYRPSRWKEETIKDKRHAFAPFSAGPRVCLGQEFALLEAGYVVVRLLQTFDAIEELEDEPRDFTHNITLVVAPRNGCKLRLRRRSPP